MAISVILLAAGYATRLHPLTLERPKALLPLADGSGSVAGPARVAARVILDEVVRSLRTIPQLRTCVLVTNRRFAAQFREWQRSRGAEVQVLDDGTETPETRLGAVGDLELARRLTDPEDDLLVVGTDNLFRWSLGEFVVRAQRFCPHPVVALWEAPSREMASQFGVVTRDRAGRILLFAEKSSQPPSAEVALCVYDFPAAMCRQIPQFLEEGGNADATGYLIAWLAQRGPVYGVMMPGAWCDIGTPEAYQAVVREWPARPQTTDRSP